MNVLEESGSARNEKPPILSPVYLFPPMIKRALSQGSQIGRWPWAMWVGPMQKYEQETKGTVEMEIGKRWGHKPWLPGVPGSRKRLEVGSILVPPRGCSPELSSCPL